MNILGIDIGGTKMAYGVVESSGHIKDFNIVPTKEECEDAINEIIQIIKEKKEKFDIDGIGIGIPGPLNPEEGIIYSIGNLKGWHNVPLKKILEEATSTEVLIDNDANAAAVGELYFGKGKELQNFVVITLGTGIGGGIIIGRKLYRGAGLIAGEVGHTKVELDGRTCGCGKKGCVEAYASGRAILEIFREIAAMRTETSVDLKSVTTKDIFEAAKNGDKLSLKVIDQAAQYLGMAISSIVNILNPQAIIFAGGLSKQKELLVYPAIDAMKERALVEATRELIVEISDLGREGPVLGAAALFLESMHQTS